MLIVRFHQFQHNSKQIFFRWIKNQYDSPEICITETGWVDKGEMEDNGRIEYINDHLKEILNVLQDKECNLKGYTIWTLIDNFEWARGFMYVMFFF